MLAKGLTGLLMCVTIGSATRAAAAEAKAKKSSTSKPAEKSIAKSGAKSSAPAGGLVRQVRIEDTWREAEVFVVLPGNTVEMRVVRADAPVAADVSDLAPAGGKGSPLSFSSSRSSDCRWKVSFGRVQHLGENQIEWVAPKTPGHYAIECEIESQGKLSYAAGEGGPTSRDLPAFRAATTFHFLVPYEFDAEGHGVIEGYPIGVYPNENAKDVKAVIADHRDRYRPPHWFVSVTSATRELFVSEHFRLREFVLNAPKDATCYFPYNANLCRALEAVLDDLKSPELPTPHVRILRGFISPYDAERLRRSGAKLITWNRYQYGDGVLVVANDTGGEKMGDLNGDGKVDVRDAETLARIVAGVQKRLRLPGWSGVYPERPDTTLPETPMVGFDVRGWWGESYGSETSAKSE
jgi:hypothetical protein